jgi:hypothetical protein
MSDLVVKAIYYAIFNGVTHEELEAMVPGQHPEDTILPESVTTSTKKKEAYIAVGEATINHMVLRARDDETPICYPKNSYIFRNTSKYDNGYTFPVSLRICDFRHELTQRLETIHTTLSNKQKQVYHAFRNAINLGVTHDNFMAVCPGQTRSETKLPEEISVNYEKKEAFLDAIEAMIDYYVAQLRDDLTPVCIPSDTYVFRTTTIPTSWGSKCVFELMSHNYFDELKQWLSIV